MAIDWKDALAGLKNQLPQEENPAPETDAAAEAPEAGPQKEPLRVVLDKKGRKGKAATIIEGFLCSDEELLDMARLLKQTIGVGGSARDGEILLQGDWRERCAEILRQKGFKVKII